MSLSLFRINFTGGEGSPLREERKLWGGLPQNLPTVLQYSILCVEVFVILIVTQPTWPTGMHVEGGLCIT